MILLSHCFWEHDANFAHTHLYNSLHDTKSNLRLVRSLSAKQLVYHTVYMTITCPFVTACGKPEWNQFLHVLISKSCFISAEKRSAIDSRLGKNSVRTSSFPKTLKPGMCEGNSSRSLFNTSMACAFPVMRFSSTISSLNSSMGSRMNNESSCVDLPQSSIQYMSKIYNENC
jgi:hypothetical protein